MNRITDLVPYLYFRIYSWNKAKWGDADGPQYNALIGVTILISFNVATLVFMLATVLDFGVAQLKENLAMLLLVIYLAAILYGYLAYVRRSKYRTLERRFSQQPDTNRTRGTVMAATYVLASFALFVWSVAFLTLN